MFFIRNGGQREEVETGGYCDLLTKISASTFALLWSSQHSRVRPCHSQWLPTSFRIKVEFLTVKKAMQDLVSSLSALEAHLYLPSSCHSGPLAGLLTHGHSLTSGPLHLLTCWLLHLEVLLSNIYILIQQPHHFKSSFTFLPRKSFLLQTGTLSSFIALFFPWCFSYLLKF